MSMMMPSHLLAALTLGLLIGLLRGRPFAREEWLLALGFGVVIDLDHLLAIPGYIAASGAAALDPATTFSYGAAWQGFMHTPWALLPVLAGMAWWRSAWPLVFWGLHMTQDFVVARHYVHFGGPLEWLIVATLASTVWGLVRLEAGRTRARSEARYRLPISLAAATVVATAASPDESR